MPTIRPLAAVVVSSLMFTACSKGGSSPESETAADTVTSSPETTVVAEPVPPPPPPAEPAPVAAAPVEDTPPPAPLTDAQITKILEAVDTGEIEQAKIAQKKAKHPRVKKFAQQMIQHHTKSKQKGTTLAKKAQITPEDSAVAAQLTGKATAQLDALKTAEGGEFDALYIQGQATQHQEVLDLVNAQLIPAATHDGLKSHLAETRTMVEGHIAQANEIQQALATSTSGAAGAAGPTSTTGSTGTAGGTGATGAGMGASGTSGTGTSTTTTPGAGTTRPAGTTP